MAQPQTGKRKLGPQLLQHYEDFSGGDYGERGGVSPPKATFRGTNVVVNADGTVSPRAGLKQLTRTSKPSGVVHGLWRVPNTLLDSGLIVVGTSVYTVDIELGASSAYQACSGSVVTPTKPLDLVNALALTSYIASQDDKIYKVARSIFGGGTVSAVSGSPGARTIERFGERLYAGGDPDFPSRLYYTDATDFDAWDTATQFIDTAESGGATNAITTLHTQRDRLLVGKENGEWFVLSGVPDDESTIGSAVLRELGAAFNGTEPRSPVAAALTPSGRVWYAGLNTDQPLSFNGVRTEPLRDQRFAGRIDKTAVDSVDPVYGASWMHGADDFVMAAGVELLGSGGKWLTFIEGAPTRHTTSVGVEAWPVYDPNRRTVLFPASGGGTVELYVIPQYLDQAPITNGNPPANTEDPEEAGGNQPSADFTLPEWWADPGQQVLVRIVAVDFTKYDNGATQNNRINLGVTPLGAYEQSGVAETASPVSFDEAPGSATAAGVRQMKLFPLVTTSQGFKVRLYNLRGVKIHRVAAWGEIAEARLT